MSEVLQMTDQYARLIRGYMTCDENAAIVAGVALPKLDSGLDYGGPRWSGTQRDYQKANLITSGASMGIILGTGTTPATRSDVDIESEIAHGSGSGQLTYGSCSFGSLGDDGSHYTVAFTRTVTNNSGAQITVTEAGLKVRIYDQTTAKFLLVGRKVLSTSIDIPNTGVRVFTLIVKIPYVPMLRNAAKVIFAQLGDDNSWSVADIAGSSFTYLGGPSGVPSAVPIFSPEGGAGVDSIGVVVGTGTTAVDKADNALETQINDGAGSGQLDHGVTTIGSEYDDSGKKSWKISRPFTNNSGGTITIREVALYVQLAQTTRKICWCRFLTTKTLLNTESCVIDVVLTA
jgi:hypothetical protein